MKSNLEATPVLRDSAYNPGAEEGPAQCIEKAILNLLSECVSGGIIITYNTPDFPLYYIDDRMLSFLNYESRRDFAASTGGAVINCIQAEDRKNLWTEIARSFLCGNSYTVTYRMLCKDGGYIWVKETGRKAVLPNGRPILVSLCLDITGQIEAQAELESIFQCPLGGIFRAKMDSDFTLIYANDHYYNLHGFTRDNLRSKLNNEAIHLVHPDDIAWMEQKLRKAVKYGEPTICLEYRVVRPDGGVVWLSMNGSFSEQDGYIMLTGMVIDISHQKMLEEQTCCRSRRQRAICAEKYGASAKKTG